MGTIDDFNDPHDGNACSAKANAMVLCNPGVDLTDAAWVKIVIGGAALAKNPAPADLIPTTAQLSLAKQVSPLFNVHKNEPPTLIIHGLDDKVILPIQSISFRDSMLKAGNRCDLELLPETRHAFILPNYTASEQTVVNVICKVDTFLTSLGYFRGSPLLRTGKEAAWIPKGSKR
jgi:acetyl esterase/lipase